MGQGPPGYYFPVPRVQEKTPELAICVHLEWTKLIHFCSLFSELSVVEIKKASGAPRECVYRDLLPIDCMMRFLFDFWIGCILINVRQGGHGLLMVSDGKGSSIECSSNYEITFKFISPVQGNDTYGTYECCETYHPSNYVTVDIIPRYIDGGDENITRCEGKQNTETSPIHIHVVIVTTIFITSIVISIIFVLWRRKVLANLMTRSPKSVFEIMMMLMIDDGDGGNDDDDDDDDDDYDDDYDDDDDDNDDDDDDDDDDDSGVFCLFM
ncbi:hypothetical protein DPMN_031913 [Dreissena polymorpha]|uniref:Uncharacterized protein n=1 Tax=Dreissena polymorpha TaxID=45954 RepID=A0A9D4M377_DREPO|nr:hypothetical protein DPMN_031913 [Dreissena polymorpha]